MHFQEDIRATTALRTILPRIGGSSAPYGFLTEARDLQLNRASSRSLRVPIRQPAAGFYMNITSVEIIRRRTPGISHILR